MLALEASGEHCLRFGLHRCALHLLSTLKGARGRDLSRHFRAPDNKKTGWWKGVAFLRKRGVRDKGTRKRKEGVTCTSGARIRLPEGGRG